MLRLSDASRGGCVDNVEPEDTKKLLREGAFVFERTRLRYPDNVEASLTELLEVDEPKRSFKVLKARPKSEDTEPIRWAVANPFSCMTDEAFKKRIECTNQSIYEDRSDPDPDPEDK